MKFSQHRISTKHNSKPTFKPQLLKVLQLLQPQKARPHQNPRATDLVTVQLTTMAVQSAKISKTRSKLTSVKFQLLNW